MSDAVVRYRDYLAKLEQFVDKVIEDSEEGNEVDYTEESYQLREEGFRVHNDLDNEVEEEEYVE